MNRPQPRISLASAARVRQEIQVRPRSGLALKEGITVWNSPGTIDEGYRNEIGVILLWAPRLAIAFSSEEVFAVDEEKVSLTIHKGDRIAQFVFAPVTRPEIVKVSEVSDTERGTGGFGSTGK